MKESQQYLNFLKNYFVLFIFFGLTGLILGTYLSSKLPTYYLAERMYEFSYTLDNAAAVEKESEQVVAVLRSAQLKKELGIQSSLVSVYKPGPFAINIQIRDLNAENAVYNLSVLAGYLSQKYQTNQIGQEIFLVENKPVIKYLLFGFIGGEMSALFISLALAYLKKF